MVMEKRAVLAEKHKETAKRLRLEKEDFLLKALERGKEAKEMREELGSYQEFKIWSAETDYSVSTLNRDINKYEFYELMQTETGKETVKRLPVILVSWINKLRMQDNEKFMELLGFIDEGLDNAGIKNFLDENIITAMPQLNGEEVREKLEEALKEIARIDIRKLKNSAGKKIMKAFDTIFKLISECTKLNTEKKSRDLSRKIEEINYSVGVLSIN